MEITIDDELIDQSVKQSFKKLGLVPEETLKGKTWDVEEFRHHCLGGKGRAWVKREIFDRYPETYVENGGFVVDLEELANGNRNCIVGLVSSDFICRSC